MGVQHCTTIFIRKMKLFCLTILLVVATTYIPRSASAEGRSSDPPVRVPLEYFLKHLDSSKINLLANLLDNYSLYRLACQLYSESIPQSDCDNTVLASNRFKEIVGRYFG